MSGIRTLDTIVEKARGVGKRVAVAGGGSRSAVEAVARGVRDGMIEAVMVGERDVIEDMCGKAKIDPRALRIIHEPDPAKVASRTVREVREGRADLLMKGQIGSADYLKAILSRSAGLVPEGGLLTHVTVIEAPAYHKLLIVSDVAILVSPDLSDKLAMLEACVGIARALDIDRPLAGIISCVEKPSFKIDSTIDGKIMKRLAGRRQIEGAIVDGPLALDLALSRRCAEEKGFESPVAGNCDILIFPDVVTGNVFFKTLTLLGGARIAAVVAGAGVPCVLTSRADTEESKYVSLALAALLA
jgi:phosphate butyryltransferase